MPATIIIGTMFGDCGKGKIVDYLVTHSNYDMVVRFQGGNNAGHTVVIGNEKFKLHHIPSGVVSGKEILLGNGMVIDPRVLLEELDMLTKKGIQPKLTIDPRAHVITEEHIKEDSKDTRLGTTKRGIGPAYRDKISRHGTRICDLSEKYPEYYKKLSRYIGNVSIKVNYALDTGKNILFEGAQGTMLDIDFGTYPYVTSSNTIAGAACTGTGIGPTKIDKVIGVAKAYTTRVGEGPFPTELKDNIGKHLLVKGNEFGTTTGRPRRCGWFDSVLVKYAIRVNGVQSLAITKLDVLCGLKELKICTAYKISGKETKEVPPSIGDFSKAEPIYEVIDGFPELSEQDWQSMLKQGYKALPTEFKSYIEFLEKELGVKIELLSTGPRRSDTFIKG